MDMGYKKGNKISIIVSGRFDLKKPQSPGQKQYNLIQLQTTFSYQKSLSLSNIPCCRIFFMYLDTKI